MALLGPLVAMAHEPLFGLGPHTIYQYGLGIESQMEQRESGWSNQLELIYGVTPEWAVTLAAPYLFATRIRSAGFGDISLRSKYRIYRDDRPGASNQAALHLGIKFPTGSKTNFRGSGSTDVLLGISMGRESIRHYYFAALRYQRNGTSDGMHRGNILRYDAAYGIRPWQLQYLQPDAVFLLELNGEWLGRDSRNRRTLSSTGGHIINLSPGLLFSYRNIMIKSGVKIPVKSFLNGEQPKPEPEYVFGLEFHLPPLF